MIVTTYTPPGVPWHCPTCAVEWHHLARVSCWCCGGDPEGGTADPQQSGQAHGHPSRPDPED